MVFVDVNTVLLGGLLLGLLSSRGGWLSTVVRVLTVAGSSSATFLVAIVAILVLYRVALEQSACFLSLREALATSEQLDGFTLLVYDNSPASGRPASFPATLLYRHDAANGGVAAAYNAGLQEARANGSEWLLLLDQDTAVTFDYLHELRDCIRTVEPTIAAIVPRLVQNGETHSPQTLPRLSHRSLPESLTGLLSIPVTAFNSGAALRVARIERFPKRYWLDFLDHAVFHELQANGGHIWLMHARLSHSLSTEDLGGDASLSRYLNVLQAERDFYRQYGSTSDIAFYHLRRLKQALGQLLKVRDKRFAKLSARAALGLLPPTPPRTS